MIPGTLKNVTLVHVTTSLDDINQSVETETLKVIPCRMTSIGRAEWSAANQSGLVPAFTLTTFSGNYNGEDKCIVDDKRYVIYRTFERSDHMVELYLKKEAGV